MTSCIRSLIMWTPWSARPRCCLPRRRRTQVPARAEVRVRPRRLARALVTRRPFRGLFGLGDEGRTVESISGALFSACEENLAATLPGQPVRYRAISEAAGTRAQTRKSA